MSLGGCVALLLCVCLWCAWLRAGSVWVFVGAGYCGEVVGGGVEGD